MIASLVQCTSLVKSAGCPSVATPIHTRKMSRTPLLSFPLRCSDASLFHSPGEIECGRDERDMSRRSPSANMWRPWTLYVREALHSIAKTTSRGHNADIDPMRDALTLHPPERFPQCTIQRGWCIAKNPVPNQPRNIFIALFVILQTF